MQEKFLMFRFRTAALVALMGAVTAATIPAAAQNTMGGMDMSHARYSQAPVYTGAPTLPLTLSVIVAGGGPSNFDSTKLVGVLAGSLTDAEVKKLSAQFGADNVGSFLKTFNFVISDSLRLVMAAKVPLPSTPAPSPTDGKALSAALYTAGVTPAGNFDVEYMLDHLVSHPIHLQVMDDINNDPAQGTKADGNYHAVLTQAVLDLKAAYKL
jgi:hypothetical protein